MAGSVQAAPLKTIPLPAEPAPKTADPADQNLFWLSAAYGLGNFGDFGVRSEGFGAYVSSGRLLIGARQRYYQDFAAVHHGRESGLLLGAFLDSKARWWAAAGLASIKVDRREPGTPVTGFHKLGVPLEAVWSPHFSAVGLELRLEGDVNGRDSMAAAMVALRFGKLR